MPARTEKLNRRGPERGAVEAMERDEVVGDQQQKDPKLVGEKPMVTTTQSGIAVPPKKGAFESAINGAVDR